MYRYVIAAQQLQIELFGEWQTLIGAANTVVC